MLSPVEIVLRPYRLADFSRDQAIDLLARDREAIEKLLGVQLPDNNPDEMFRIYISSISRLRGEFKELCYRDICLYQYKDMSARRYLEKPVLSAMRGTVIRWFDNGESRLLAFPFAKFFNYGEVDATREPPASGFRAVEKLDGTLIIGWRDEDGELHFNTRGLLEWYGVKFGKGSTYIYRGDGIENPYVRAFISSVKRAGLWSDLESVIDYRSTVMFELVGRVPASQFDPSEASAIDVDDPSWRPFILAKRDNSTFDLEYVDSSPFPLPEIFDANDLNELARAVREWRNREGVVLFYRDKQYRDGELFRWWNYLVKVKSPRYVIMGEVLRNNRIWWRGVAKYTILGAYDDLLSLLEDPEARGFVEKVHNLYVEARSVWSDIAEMIKGGALTGSRVNYISNNMNMKWIIPFLKELKHGVDSETVLRRLIISNLPRKKEAILSFIERLINRLRTIRSAL